MQASVNTIAYSSSISIPASLLCLFAGFNRLHSSSLSLSTHSSILHLDKGEGVGGIQVDYPIGAPIGNKRLESYFARLQLRAKK
jgi:hypothetical protein